MADITEIQEQIEAQEEIVRLLKADKADESKVHFVYCLY